MTIYSHSRLNTFETCPQMFKYRYLDKIRTPFEKTVETHLGKVVHETLEWLYTEVGFGKIPELDDALIYYRNQWTSKWEDTIKIVRKNLTKEDYFNKGLQFLVSYYMKHKPFNDNTIDMYVGTPGLGAIVCVPTPTVDGICDDSMIREVLEELGEVPVLLKCTVPPNMLETYPSNVTYNPEFLRAKTAEEDFKNQNRIIIGGPEESLEILSQVFESSFPEVPLFKTSSSVAELVKYTTNCFLAVKVSFANELFELCKAINVDYDEVAKHATKDERLGNSHWSVPGPDGKNGFGGSCFPKDLNAILQLCKSNDVDCSTMSAAWETNLRVRPEKDWETLKGRAVSE